MKIALNENRQPAWWVCFNLVLIALSGVSVLYPSAHHTAFFLVPFTLFLPVYFFALIRREWTAGRGNIPPIELYKQVKAGRKLTATPLELAAIVALLLSVALA